MLRELHELFLKVFCKSEWLGVIRILGITDFGECLVGQALFFVPANVKASSPDYH